jgi:hypothetical protein
MPRKPNTSDAMRYLIQEVRKALPLDLSPPEVCTDECRGCSIKLLEYIAMELESWECRLLKKLARSSNKIYLALLKNGLVGS